MSFPETPYTRSPTAARKRQTHPSSSRGSEPSSLATPLRQSRVSGTFVLSGAAAQRPLCHIVAAVEPSEDGCLLHYPPAVHGPSAATGTCTWRLSRHTVDAVKHTCAHAGMGGPRLLVKNPARALQAPRDHINLPTTSTGLAKQPSRPLSASERAPGSSPSNGP